MAIVKKKLVEGGLTYKVMVRDPNGQWYPMRQFTTKADAKAYEGVLNEEKRKGATAKATSVRDILFNDYWGKWSGDCRLKVSDGWKMSQDQMYRDHIKPIIGKAKLTAIDQSNVGYLLSKCRDKGLGPQMQIHIYNLLHKMFKDSINIYKFRESNPVVEDLRPKLNKIEKKFIQPSQVIKFLDSVSDHWLGPALWIMTLCGLRSGEMQALRVSDIHLDEADPHLLVREQWNRKENCFGPLKGGKPLRAPMPPMLVEYLKVKLQDVSGFVVKGKRNGSHVAHGTLYRAVKRLAKVGLDGLSPHELRHTCAEFWKDSGANTKTLQYLLNHSSEVSTRGYEHRVDDHLNRIAKNVGRDRKAPPVLSVVQG